MAVHLSHGEVLQSGATGPAVKALQGALRALGYLRRDVDGVFGPGTVRAVKALQYDLLHNHGESTNSAYPAKAPVAMTDFNLGAVTEVTGLCDEKLAGVVEALLACPEIGLVPQAADPVSENQKARRAILEETDPSAPPEFVLAIAGQESGGQQFLTLRNDHYLVVGLDQTDGMPKAYIPSRGYGIGQYTLFHQPPGKTEMEKLSQPAESAAKIFSVLSEKFAHFILGGSSDADDRIAEHGRAPLRTCQYAKDDPRYMRNCRACAQAAKKVDITAGMPFYPGSKGTYQSNRLYQTENFKGVPCAADFACDWPYAVRRYNGAGILSYFYQCRILLNLMQ